MVEIDAFSPLSDSLLLAYLPQISARGTAPGRGKAACGAGCLFPALGSENTGTFYTEFVEVHSFPQVIQVSKGKILQGTLDRWFFIFLGHRPFRGFK